LLKNLNHLGNPGFGMLGHSRYSRKEKGLNSSARKLNGSRANLITGNVAARHRICWLGIEEALPSPCAFASNQFVQRIMATTRIYYRQIWLAMLSDGSGNLVNK
jgi:hypothetical protein